MDTDLLNNKSNAYIDMVLVEGNVVAEDRHVLFGKYNNSLVVETKFVNLSSQYLVISFRDGTSSVLPPAVSGPYLEVLMVGHTKSNHISPINIIAGDECGTTVKLRNKLISTNGRVLYWEESVDINKVKVTRNGIYLSSADVVVTLAERVSMMDGHPFSKQRVHNLYLNAGDDFNSMKDINIGMRFVDNDATLARLYAIFHNRIIILDSKKSNTMATGVYISGLPSIQHENSNSIRRDEFYSVEKVLSGECPVKMFKTLAEAQEALLVLKELMTNDSIKTREHELFIAEIKREKERLENENNILRLKTIKEKEELLEKEAQIAKELAEQKAQADRELTKVKEDALKQVNEHKATIEKIKLASVFTAAAFGLIKLLT